MATIFISYSRHDTNLVAQCIKLLIRRGHQCIDEQTVPPGTIYEQELRKLQDESDGTVVFITKNSEKSHWVALEISAALSNYNHLNKFLIPVVDRLSTAVPEILSKIQSITYIDDPVAITQQIHEGILAWQSRPKQENIESVKRSTENNPPNPSPTPQQKTETPQPPTNETPTKLQREPASWYSPYWLLTIDEDSWGPVDPGDNIFFQYDKAPRSEHANYSDFEHVQDGNLILAYAYNGLNAVIWLLTVIEPLHYDEKLGRIMTLRLVEQFLPAILLSTIQTILPRDYIEQLASTSRSILFPLTEDIYNQILAAPRPNKRFNNGSITPLHADIPDATIVDRLGFEKDVAALASVMAYTKVQPPLAIGLFGNWGSGKSFFMNKLEDRIRFLSRQKSPDYCTDIIHIKFNSWHYSDSNLWASMITKIFEDIEKHNAGRNNELQSLFANLNSSKELLADARDEKIRVEGQINVLEQKQVTLEVKIAESKETLAGVSYLDIAKSVFRSNTFIQNKLKDGKEKLSILNADNFSKVQDNLNELDTTYGRIKHTLRFALDFRHPKPFLALFIATLAFFGLKWFFELDFIVAYVNNAIAKVIQWLLPATTAIITFLRPAVKRLQQAQAFMTEVKAATDAEATKLYQAEKAGIEADLKSAQNQKAEIGTNIGALEAKKASIEQELVAIQSGRRLAKFIEGRVTDERYVNSLGIISWIRKDFEELDHLLKQQLEATNTADKLASLAGSEQQPPPPLGLRVERIILYIDDLDRCEAPIVVKVLEAIHLLLAFPLFVVVVGVDPRWMHNALRTKYQNFLAKEKKAPDDDKSADDIILGKPATSYDYLEKIFQIPLVLKPMNKQGKDDLIAAQFSAGPGVETSSLPSDFPNSKAPTQPNPGTGPTPQNPIGPPPPDPGPKAPPHTANAGSQVLTVSPEEIKFMQSIGYLVGDSPRNIKRYINIYRIIRTHSNFEFLDDKVLEDYYVAMILLGILLAIADNAKDFFHQLNNADDKHKFTTLIANFLDSTDANKASSASAGDNRDINAPLRRLRDAMQLDPALKTIGNMRLQKFKHNAALICRFSFRDVSS